MSEAARKSEFDAEAAERARRALSPRSDDPLAELARIVGGAEPPRRAQPVDALSRESRAALTADEEDFLNELSLAVDRARPPVRSAPPRPAEANADADEALSRARAALDRHAQVRAGDAPSLPAASFPPAATQAPSAIDAPPVEAHPLKASAPLRGSLDVDGLSEMTALEAITRDAPTPRLPQATAALTMGPALGAPIAHQPVQTAAARVEPKLSDAPLAAAPRDLDDAFAGEEAFAPMPAPAREPARASVFGGRRRLAVVVALAGFGVAAAGVAMTLKRGPSATGAPPTVLASTEPVKVAPPAAPKAAADQADDLLSRKPRPDAGAKIVDGAEKPVDLAREAQKVVRTIPLTAAKDPRIPSTPMGDAASPDKFASIFPEPKRVRTVSVRPDGTIVGAPAQPAPSASAPAAAAAVAPSAAAKTPAPVPPPPLATPPAAAPSSAALKTEARVGAPPPPPIVAPEPVVEPAAAAPVRAEAKPAAPRTASQPAAQTVAKPTPPATPKVAAQAATPKPAAPARAARVEPAPVDAAPEAEVEAPKVEQVRNPFATLFGGRQQATPQTTASTVASATPAAPARADSGGGYAVQLASSPTESDARAAASRLGSRYGDALNGRSAGVVKGEASGRTVYRVRVGNLSREGAVSACERVKSAGGACFVARD
jgi:hypothetical protein